MLDIHGREAAWSGRGLNRRNFLRVGALSMSGLTLAQWLNLKAYGKVNEAKAISMGIPVADVYQTLQATMGSLYVNDFNFNGRTYRAQLQADAQYRIRPGDVKQLRVRNADGQMVPLGAIAAVKDSSGPVHINRYNTYTAAAINGSLTRLR